MDSTARTASRDYEIINKTAVMGDAWIRQREQQLGTHKSSKKLLSRVTHGFDSPNSPYELRNNQRTAATGDECLRLREQPLGTHKSSTNFCHG
jgi:hypothetical protein